jgi:hypothetical protein
MPKVSRSPQASESSVYWPTKKEAACGFQGNNEHNPFVAAMNTIPTQPSP